MGTRSKRFSDLADLPDWPLLLTDAGAAAYLSLEPRDFARGVRDGALPPPRRTPGGDRWSRRDLDACYGDTTTDGRQAQDALLADIDAWSRP